MANGRNPVDGFLDSVKPYTFRYKQPDVDGMSSDQSKNGKPFAGVMAQNLAADPIGKQTVLNTPHGMQLEIKPLVSALAAGEGRLHGRLSELEHGHMGLANAVKQHVRGLHEKVDATASMVNNLHKILSAKLGQGSRFSDGDVGGVEHESMPISHPMNARAVPEIDDNDRVDPPAVPGNIDTQHRPHVQNADGSSSSVRSIGVGEDNSEVLIPTVSEDGRIMSNDEATRSYRESGRHLGKFNTVDQSNKYASALHNAQDRMSRDNYPGSPILKRLAQGSRSK